MALKRLVIISETYRPEINGVATTLGHWVDGLLSRGCEVHIIRPKQSDEDIHAPKETASKNQILVKGLPIPGYSELKFGLVTKSRIRKHLNRIKPDVVYIATEGPLGYAALNACKQLEIKAVTGFHTNFQSYSRFYSFGFLESFIFSYLRWFHNTSAATLVPTRQQQNMLFQRNFQRVKVVSRGIDATKFHPSKRCDSLRHSWGASKHDPVFIYVGRIAAEKNLDLFAQTYERVTAKHPTAKFVLIGNGPLKPVLSEKYPNLIFSGVKRGDELARHYASGDIFLFPSKTDTFGNVVTEAMASGCCVVSFNDAAAGEHLTHRRSGLLAEITDNEAFIGNAIEAYENRNLRWNVALGSRAVAEQLDWSSVVDKFCNTLESAPKNFKGDRHANRTSFGS